MIIAVCDDSREDRQRIREICRNHLTGAQVYEFPSGELLIQSSINFDLIFLDIEMTGINGIEVKEYLQKRTRRSPVIYISSHPEIMREAFGPNVYDFIEKAELETRLPESIRKYENLARRHTEVDGIDSRDIVYIETDGNYLRITLKSGDTVTVRATMKRLQEILEPCSFLRISEKHLVNFYYIEKYSKDRLEIPGGELPVACRRRKAVQERYRELCRENARYF